VILIIFLAIVLISINPIVTAEEQHDLTIKIIPRISGKIYIKYPNGVTGSGWIDSDGISTHNNIASGICEIYIDSYDDNYYGWMGTVELYNDTILEIPLQQIDYIIEENDLQGVWYREKQTNFLTGNVVENESYWEFNSGKIIKWEEGKKTEGTYVYSENNLTCTFSNYWMKLMVGFVANDIFLGIKDGSILPTDFDDSLLTYYGLIGSYPNENHGGAVEEDNDILEKENEKTPGFELIYIIFAIALILLLKRK
jgi:hypothetical protein